MELLAIGISLIILAISAVLFWTKKSDTITKDQHTALIEESNMLKISLAKYEERVNSLEQEKDTIVDLLKTEQERLLVDLEAERNKRALVSQEVEKSRAYFSAQQERMVEQRREMEQLQVRFNKDFELIASKIIDEKSQKFTDLNRTNLDILLNPLKENIKAFEDKVEKVYKAESDERNVLKGEISKLMELNREISEEAHNLTRALKTDSKKQGNWGEVVLDRVLEASGLSEGESYTKQGSLIAADGSRMQPDVIIMLPDKKHVIVDAKVSLIAYERLVNCETEDERKQHLKDHLISVRSHIASLGAKNYHELYSINSPDFVLLFVPIESSFAIAVQNDLDLFEFAWNKRVVLVTPSTLLATLRTIASIWKQEQQTRNALEIATKAGALYDKFVSFIQDMNRIGDSLNRAQGHYNDAFGKLSSGNGNLVGRVEGLRKLGARNTKAIDEKLLEEEG